MIDSAKLKRLVLLNFPYVFLFWFFNKAGEAVTAAPGRGFLQKLMYGIANLNISLSNPLPSLDPTDLLAGLVGAAGIYYAVLYKRLYI